MVPLWVVIRQRDSAGVYPVHLGYVERPAVARSASVGHVAQRRYVAETRIASAVEVGDELA